MEFWFRRKYLLAPTDPRFLDADFATMYIDYYTWRALEHPNEVQDEDDEFDVDEVVRSMEESPEDWEPL